ncbi:hypothetical protein BI049_gp105 [Salmonella phage vB_SnwM_CGG4-1]|uniref:Uncharacterized protein n=1 Tax=Salmonella phage vB_SnwM_CGG4-1 TaxID=1815631 RepID=A0A1B0VV85_9CAUD|nr:hypothetical protein BI049_gp105 [Salmonella phage vB_SnwM_CGG4-1]ANA49459.1 hypothetical protein CGG41_104 [Salmonella phage vB_SnwM_CGG4-1]
MKKLLCLLLVPFVLSAWEKLPGYPEEVLALTGKQIETSGSFKRNVELIYVPSEELLGISFYNYDDKGDQVVIPVGSFNIRGCEKSAKGEIEQSSLIASSDKYNIAKNIMKECDTFFIRIYNDTDEYSTYMVKK